MKDSPVIVGTDGSETSLRAVEWAAREAVLHGWPLRIVSVPAMPPLMSWYQHDDPPTVTDMIRDRTEQALMTAAARATEIEPGLEVSTALRVGPPSRALARASEGASMLVVGSRGAGGLAALLLGSVSRDVAFAAECPVVVVREETMAAHQQIVVGVRDLDQPSALSFAFEEARLRRARLHVAYAWQLFLPAMRLAGTERPGADAKQVGAEAARWLSGLIGVWRDKYPEVEVDEDTVHAAPSRIMIAASARADLLVLGRNSPPDQGSHDSAAVAHAVLSHAHCPVAIIPE
jgi:nucleotide-binding universal stress UspA family protein